MAEGSKLNPGARRNLGSLAIYNVLRGFSVGGYQALFGFYMSSLGYAMRSVGGAASIASLVGALLAPAVGYLRFVRLQGYGGGHRGPSGSRALCALP